MEKGSKLVMWFVISIFVLFITLIIMGTTLANKLNNNTEIKDVTTEYDARDMNNFTKKYPEFPENYKEIARNIESKVAYFPKGLSDSKVVKYNYSSDKKDILLYNNVYKGEDDEVDSLLNVEVGIANLGSYKLNFKPELVKAVDSEGNIIPLAERIFSYNQLNLSGSTGEDYSLLFDFKEPISKDKIDELIIYMVFENQATKEKYEITFQ